MAWFRVGSIKQKTTVRSQFNKHTAVLYTAVDEVGMKMSNRWASLETVKNIRDTL